MNTIKSICRKTDFGWSVKVGSVEAKIYAGESRGKPLFTIAYHQDGSRKRETRATWEDAKARAEQVADDISTGNAQADSVQMRPEDRMAYGRAVTLLAPYNLPVDIGARDLVGALEKLAGRSLAQAVDYFIARHPTGQSSKSVSEAVEALLAAKQADGCSAVYLKTLRHHLTPFATAFQVPLSAVDSAQLSDWLRTLPVSGRTRNNYRHSIRTLMFFAVGQRWIPTDHIDWANGVSLAKVADNVIDIFTPAEIAKLIAQAVADNDRVCLAHLVLGAFAGMRTAEILRQKWEDINIARGHIRVSAVKGGTAARRLIPIRSNLRTYLADLALPAGPVLGEVTADELHTKVRNLAKAAGVVWKHNSLRHSYISYRVAEVQNVAQVALEAGNSPEVIHSNYRELVSPEDAQAYFSVSSLVPENVVRAA